MVHIAYNPRHGGIGIGYSLNDGRILTKGVNMYDSLDLLDLLRLL